MTGARKVSIETRKDSSSHVLDDPMKHLTTLRAKKVQCRIDHLKKFDDPEEQLKIDARLTEIEKQMYEEICILIALRNDWQNQNIQHDKITIIDEQLKQSDMKQIYQKYNK